MKQQFCLSQLVYVEAATRTCLVKTVLLKISQISQETTWARVFFLNNVAGLRPVTLLKKRLWHRCLPVSFVTFLRAPISIEHFWWLLLPMANFKYFVAEYINNMSGHFWVILRLEYWAKFDFEKITSKFALH